MSVTVEGKSRMATKEDVQTWVVDALRALDGKAQLVDVAKHIWQAHRRDLKQSGSLFYTWQVEIRVAATMLRKDNIMKPADGAQPGLWELTAKKTK
jgi:hypothetical protein